MCVCVCVCGQNKLELSTTLACPQNYHFILYSAIVRTHTHTHTLSLSLSLSLSHSHSLVFVVFQFAQFALLTQTVAVFGTYVLQYSTIQHLKAFLLGQTVSLMLGHMYASWWRRLGWGFQESLLKQHAHCI